MTTQTKIIVAQSILIVGGLGYGGYQALKAHDAILTSDARQQASNEQRAALESKDKQIQTLTAQQIAAVKTVPQAVKVITQYVPVKTSDRKPAVIETQRQDLPAQVQTQIADSPSYTVQTQEQTVVTAQKLLQCSLEEQLLNSCNEKLAMSDADAKRWEQTAKGGSKWHRIVMTAKNVGIGAAVGIAIGYAAHR